MKRALQLMQINEATHMEGCTSPMPLRPDRRLAQQRVALELPGASAVLAVVRAPLSRHAHGGADFAYELRVEKIPDADINGLDLGSLRAVATWCGCAMRSWRQCYGIAANPILPACQGRRSNSRWLGRSS